MRQIKFDLLPSVVCVGISKDPRWHKTGFVAMAVHFFACPVLTCQVAYRFGYPKYNLRSQSNLYDKTLNRLRIHFYDHVITGYFVRI